MSPPTLKGAMSPLYAPDLALCLEYRRFFLCRRSRPGPECGCGVVGHQGERERDFSVCWEQVEKGTGCKLLSILKLRAKKEEAH